MLYRLTFPLRKSCQTYNIYLYVVISAKLSRPKLLLPCRLHLTLTLRTGSPVPDTDLIAATVQAQPPYLASVGRGYISNDAADHKILDRLAVGAAHCGNLLTEKASPFIYISLVSTGFTSVFQFPCHLLMYLIYDVLCSIHGLEVIVEADGSTNDGTDEQGEAHPQGIHTFWCMLPAEIVASPTDPGNQDDR